MRHSHAFLLQTLGRAVSDLIASDCACDVDVTSETRECDGKIESFAADANAIDGRDINLAPIDYHLIHNHLP
jgi:hypothetical protein